MKKLIGKIKAWFLNEYGFYKKWFQFKFEKRSLKRVKDMADNLAYYKGRDYRVLKDKMLADILKLKLPETLGENVSGKYVALSNRDIRMLQSVNVLKKELDMIKLDKLSIYIAKAKYTNKDKKK